MAALTARTEFASALNQVCHERGIEPEVVLETIKEAVLAAFRRDYGLNEEEEHEVTVNPETGETRIYSFSKEKPEDKKDETPPGFGRIAAQVAKQVILQKIREAEKEAVLGEYNRRMGTLINGMVLRLEGRSVIIDIGKTEALMPLEEQIRNESYRVNQRLTLYLSEIRETNKGRRVIVSRAHPQLVADLFRREVPEVASGAVEIKVIAREAGVRTKVAVHSKQAGVDPVGSCVGQKGVRVQAVINELNKEKIDIIQYFDDPVKFIQAALSPAEKVEVKVDLERKEAQVTIAEDQLSLAIGKEGQNVRLAGRLTGFKIEINGASARKPVVVPVKKQKKSKLTGQKVDELLGLGLSPRLASLLEKAGIKSQKELNKKSLEELGKIKGVGPKALETIKKALF